MCCLAKLMEHLRLSHMAVGLETLLALLRPSDQGGTGPVHPFDVVGHAGFGCHDHRSLKSPAITHPHRSVGDRDLSL